MSDSPTTARVRHAIEQSSRLADMLRIQHYTSIDPPGNAMLATRLVDYADAIDELVRVAVRTLTPAPPTPATPVERVFGIRVVFDDAVPLNEIRVHSVTFNPSDMPPPLNAVRILMDPEV